jgi:hypothetical protein
MALARKNDREIENFIKQQQKVSNVWYLFLLVNIYREIRI